MQMSEFPLSPNGKIDRKALPYPDNVRLLSQTPYTPPLDEIHRHLIRIWEKVLQLKPVGITDRFDRLGGDSLATVEIIRLMEKEMGCNLPLAAFANAKTIQDQAEIISSGQKPSQSVYLCRQGNKTPILFIRHVQGDITLSGSLMKYLGPDHSFFAALPFGMEPETVPDSIEEIAQIYVTSLENQYPSQEYIVGGFSMGGLVALEIASILKSKGKSVKALFFIDTYHPEIQKKERNNYQTRKRVLFYLKGLLKENFQNKKVIIKHLTERWISTVMNLFQKDEKLPVIRKFQEFLGLHIDKNKLYAENRNIYLSFKFRPKSYTGDVLLVSAQNKKRPCIYPDISHNQDRNENIIKWKNNISGKLYTFEVQGNHDDIMNEPVVASIANLINKHLLKD
jgi:thioesterase domain-containing protein/acyl carrier protein